MMKLFSRKTEKKKNSKLATDGKPILKFTQEEQFEFLGIQFILPLFPG